MLTLDESYAAAVEGREVVVQHPPARRLIRISGPQRVWFLQNTITADVEAAEAGTWIESCLLDERGRVFAHFLAGITDEAIYLSDVPAYGERLGEWFRSRRFRTKVEIEEVDAPRFTVFGPGLEPERFALDPPAFGRSFGDVDATDVFGPREATAPFELYDILRVEAGYGRYGVDFDDRTLPQEAGLTRTLAMDKGCYVGQETVARIHFRGHINKVLRTLRFEDDVEVGAELTKDGEHIGKVTSFVRSPRLGPIGIAMTRVEPAEGTAVKAGDVEATLGPLPEGTKIKAS